MLEHNEIKKLIVALDENYLEKVKAITKKAEAMEEKALLKGSGSRPNQGRDLSGRFEDDDDV